MSVLIQYDPEVDVLYVMLREAGPGAAKRTHQVDERRLVDYDEHEEAIGVEFQQASEGIEFDGLPSVEEIRAALRAWPRLVPARP